MPTVIIVLFIPKGTLWFVGGCSVYLGLTLHQEQNAVIKEVTC